MEEGGANGGLNGDFGGTFPFDSRMLGTDGERIHYVDEGPSDAPPVVMLHGNPTWSYMYRRPLAELAARGHRAIAFDHLGFGRSNKPARRSELTFARHVERAAALFDALDLSDAVIVTHDWGGPIGFGVAVAQPDRVRGAVAMNTWAWELPSFVPPFLREFRRDGLGEILTLGGNMLVESIPGGMCTKDTDPVMMDAYRAPFPDYWSRLGQLCLQREIPLNEDDPGSQEIAAIHDQLPRLDIPLHLVWGMRDPVFVPAFLEQWRALFPDAETTELDDAGHYLVEDSPDAVTDAVHEFVTSL